MNPTMRFLVVLACLVVAALESPRAAAVLAEDAAGPYAACNSAPPGALELPGARAAKGLVPDTEDRAPRSTLASIGPWPETPHDARERTTPRRAIAGSR